MTTEVGDFAKLMLDLVGNKVCCPPTPSVLFRWRCQCNKIRISRYVPSGTDCSHHTLRREKEGTRELD